MYSVLVIWNKTQHVARSIVFLSFLLDIGVKPSAVSQRIRGVMVLPEDQS